MMATRMTTDHESTTGFQRPAPLGSSEGTEGTEVTYWPGLRGVVECADPLENRGSRFSTEHRADSPPREVTPLIRWRRQTTPARRFQVLQQWEGVVTRVEGAWFEADLCDLTVPTNPMEMAEFPFAEVSPADRPLIRPGCVFYWVIGYETRPGGQITNSSEIRVRRAPHWTRRKLDELNVRARELFTLEGEDGETAPRPE